MDEIGLADVRLELNSLGQPHERLQHRKALISYFEQHAAVLDEEAKRRLYSNPLRILDTKNPTMQAMVEGAPKLMDYLGEASLAHFQTLTKILDANGVAYRLNPRLVRGMDYYNLTVFEFTTDRLGSQGTVCAGGRYDYLFEQLGGKPAPAVGWALGVDRVLELVRSSGGLGADPVPDAFAIVTDASAMPVVLRSLQALRKAGVSVQMQPSAGDTMGSMKSQFKRADSSGARYALIFGADELTSGQVTVKPLRDATSSQRQQPLDDIAGWARSLQSAA